MPLIVLVFLIYYIGKMAQQRGMNALRWRTRLAVAWLIADFLVAGSSLYLTRNFVIATISGFLAGVLVALIVFQALKKEVAAQHRDADNERDDNRNG